MKRRIFFPVALAALLLTGCSGAAVPEPEPEAVDVVESAAPEEPQETAPENDTEPEGEEPEA